MRSRFVGGGDGGGEGTFQVGAGWGYAVVDCLSHIGIDQIDGMADDDDVDDLCLGLYWGGSGFERVEWVFEACVGMVGWMDGACLLAVVLRRCICGVVCMCGWCW